MAGTFQERADLLIEQAKGRWTAHCEVDQVYAHYQEVHPEFHHPRGGQAFYLRDTLYLGFWPARMAPGLVNARGIVIEDRMKMVAEGLSSGVFLRAPWEFNDLRRSGHPFVTRDGVKVYDRPPRVRRLTEDDLRLKGRLRYLRAGRR